MSAREAMRQAVDTAFGRFGRPATYTGQAESVSAPVIVVAPRKGYDAELGARVVVADVGMDVRATDITAPQGGDTITTDDDGRVYRVVGAAEMDAHGLVHKLTVRETAG